VSRARWAALAIGAAAVFFAVQGGEYSTLDHRQLRREQRAESLQVATLQRMVDSLAEVAEAVETDPAVQERIARERYRMIRDGEFVYILVPDRPEAP
jgi:cell division protein FtsB